MATRGFSFKGLVDYVLSLRDSFTDKINSLTANDVRMSNPNLFINGDFSVNQRGSDAKWVGDRWQYFAYTTSGNIDFRVVDLRASTTDRKVASHAAHVSKDASTTYANISLSQKIEMGIAMIGEEVTVSGSLRVRAKDTWQGVDTLRNYFERCELRYGASYDTRLSLLPSQWEFSVNKFDSRYIDFSVTFPPLSPSDASVDYAEVLFWASATNIDWTLLTFTNMKCELGSVATPFVPDALATNLMKCQRYYSKLDMMDFGISMGYADGGSGFTSTIYFPVTMRAKPVVKVACNLPRVRNTASTGSFTGTVTPVAYDASTARISLVGGNIAADIVSFLGGHTIITADAEI